MPVRLWRVVVASVEPSPCPEDDDSHEEGQATTVSLRNELRPGVAVDLSVNVSEHEHPGGSLERALVEMRDAGQTLALLTPEEAVHVARALLVAASVVNDSAQRVDARRTRYIGRILSEEQAAPADPT
jgi:hypothetical protein